MVCFHSGKVRTVFAAPNDYVSRRLDFDCCGVWKERMTFDGSWILKLKGSIANYWTGRRVGAKIVVEELRIKVKRIRAFVKRALQVLGWG